MSFGIRRRARKADRYVQIDNAFLRDTSISIEARGMGAYLLTHTESFRVSASQLGKACGTGRDKTRRLVAELENAGYLVREQVRTAGRFDEIEFSMSDEKSDVAPVTENPSTADQSPETSTHKKTSSKKTKDPEDQLSEGDTAGAAPADEIGDAEVDVKTRTQEPTLFEVEAPPSPPVEPSAKDVVAAYVDSFRATHQREPLRRDIGRVASDAKALLKRDEAAVSELVEAATTMGKGAFSNLAMQLKINRGTGRVRPAMAQPILEDDDRWRDARMRTMQVEAEILASAGSVWDEVPA